MEAEDARPPEAVADVPPDNDGGVLVVEVAKLVGTAVPGVVASFRPAPRKLAFVPSVTVSGAAVAAAVGVDVGVGVAVRRASLKGREAVMVVSNLPLSTSMPRVR